MFMVFIFYYINLIEFELFAHFLKNYFGSTFKSLPLGLLKDIVIVYFSMFFVHFCGERDLF